ncbi:MAG TPA: hypothetical protein VFT22_25515 [Kofleriaceae bacterium]|nr:hypothetical protein [Kofleriaceae bacterium]
MDTRNAVVRGDRDHRVPLSGTIVPTRVVQPGPTGTRVAYAPPPSVMYPPQFAPNWLGPAQMYAQGPIYAQPPLFGQLGSLFGGLNLGQVVALAADAFAAFKSLPAAPAPTGDVGTDIANDVLYQCALARELKLEKQIEFGGRLAWGLLGAR